jgi:thiol-disulfide isomerase/thioredoxin
MPILSRSSLMPSLLAATLAASLAASLLAATLLAAPALAQTSPEPGATAEQVMAKAEAQAAAEHKNILITFGASWCGNCRLFDKFLADPTIHPILFSKFLHTDLETGERPSDTHHANIPGGQKLQASLGGKEAGWPYLAIVDPSGKLIADSMRPGAGNIGYPDSPAEIDWFVQMLQKSAPSLTAQETTTIHTWLTTHSSTRR